MGHGEGNRVVMRSVIVIALLVLAAALPRTSTAEPQLDQPIRLAIKAHFEERLNSDTCQPYFRFYSLDIVNWLWQPEGVKTQVVFYVEFTGSKVLYGNSARARECLGRDSGEGYFQMGQMYRSGGFVYTLSKWSQGWHVDKMEMQP